MNKTEPMVLCPVCGSTELRTERQEKEARTERGASVRYWQEFFSCRSCDEEFLTAEQSEASSQAYASALRKAERLLSPDEIREARLRLGMTQEDFEVALGVGKKTVVRWERGTVVPSRAANGLLWFAVRYPSVFMEYARERARAHGAAVLDEPIIAHIQQDESDVSGRKVMRFQGSSKIGTAIQGKVPTDAGAELEIGAVSVGATS